MFVGKVAWERIVQYPSYRVESKNSLSYTAVPKMPSLLNALLRTEVLLYEHLHTS
jgi:hypothetical protein